MKQPMSSLKQPTAVLVVALLVAVAGFAPIAVGAAGPSTSASTVDGSESTAGELASTFDVHSSTFDVRSSTFDVRSSTFDVRSSTFDVRSSTFGDCDFPLTVTDATGTEVTIDAEPERLVALHPSTAQILWELDTQDRVVGMPVTAFTAYLDGHDEPENVYGDDGFPVTERVIDVEPDLVIASGSHDPERIEMLREAGLTVFAFPPSTSIEEIREETRTVGELVGACDEAEATVDWMDERLSIVEEAVENQDRPGVYLAMGGGWTAGEGTFQHELILAAGGENIATQANLTEWGQVSDEVILDADPDWIVYGDTAPEPPVGEAAKETTAWETDQVVAVNANYLSQPAPRVVHAIEALASELHPEAYAEAAATPTPTETPTPTDTPTPEPQSDDPDEAAATGGQPGFGVLAGVGAVIAALTWALVARRS